MNYTELESRLDADLQAAQEAGFHIVRGSYGETGMRTCCAVSAGVLLLDPLAFTHSRPSEIAKSQLGLSDDELEAITHGFDNWLLPPLGNKELFAIGRRLAKKYIDNAA